MNIYGEITKVEPLGDGTIRVTGVASTGAIDEADERVLPAAMKAALPAYMRFGALREMHGLSAAGATLSAEVTDDGATRIETHVVDPVAVKKVQLGVYKGFSIGGKVLERDPTDRRVITKLRLNEISLVDRPCNPEAVIDVWKADRADDGPTNAEVLAEAEALAQEAGLPGRRSQFVVKARERLVRARAAVAPRGLEPDDEPDAPAMDADDDLGPADEDNAGLLDADSNPGNDADAPASLMDLLDQLEAQLDGLPGDEAWELVSELAARWSAAPFDPKAATYDDLRKLEADNARLSRAVGLAAPRIDALERDLDALTKRLETVAAEPAAPRAAAGRIRAVSKAEDAGDSDPTLSADAFRKYLDTLPEDERGRLQLRAALSQPIRIDPR
jgi:hypothetical protein